MDNAVFDRANKFFENHTFEVYYLFDSEGEPIASTNVKIKLTGVKDYISMGTSKPFVQFTAYILPSNHSSSLILLIIFLKILPQMIYVK